jgi:hypothetical protein
LSQGRWGYEIRKGLENPGRFIRLSTRAVLEYLEALDEEALAETLPKRLSLTDTQAHWTAAPGGPAFYAYSTNYLIDIEHGVIVDVEPTPALRTAEV